MSATASTQTELDEARRRIASALELVSYAGIHLKCEEVEHPLIGEFLARLRAALEGRPDPHVVIEKPRA